MRGRLKATQDIIVNVRGWGVGRKRAVGRGGTEVGVLPPSYRPPSPRDTDLGRDTNTVTQCTSAAEWVAGRA